MEENRSLSISTPEEPPIQHCQPEPLVECAHVVQATSNKSRVVLQVVPVTLYGPCGQLNAHALLDPCSTCSFIRGDVADQFDLNGTVNEDSNRYLVENALVADKLNVLPTSVNIADVQSQWKHLPDIELQDVDRAEIEVILGSDVTEIIIPREVREGPRRSPFGIKTKPGWTVTGTLPSYSRD